MKKFVRHASRTRRSFRPFDTLSEKPLNWLPIDSRLIPLLSFPHVHGVARVFLIVEMCFATIIVIGTMILVVLRSLT